MSDFKAKMHHPRNCVVIVSVASVGMSVCLHRSMCLGNAITFESLDGECSFLVCGYYWGNTGQVLIWRSSGQGQGHRSKKSLNFLFLQCKTAIGSNSGSVEDRAMSMCTAWVFGYGGSNDVTAIFITWLKIGYMYSRVVCLMLMTHLPETRAGNSRE